MFIVILRNFGNTNRFFSGAKRSPILCRQFGNRLIGLGNLGFGKLGIGNLGCYRLDIVRRLYLVYFRINGKHLLVQNTTISLMKMLKRMGEITEPCGRPILVWNHTGSRSNRPQTKSAPSQNYWRIKTV
jgi:hypothetical protein